MEGMGRKTRKNVKKRIYGGSKKSENSGWGPLHE